MSKSDAYSPLKAVRHLDIIQGVRDGAPVRPAHVQIILSDLCNHACMPAGTWVDCPNGPRRIEDIAAGDYVIGPDGKLARVEYTFSRESDHVYEIRIGQRIIRATGDHPVLTERGWCEAGSLAAGDRAVVRVRLRETSQVEPHDEAMVPQSERTPKGTGEDMRPDGGAESLRVWMRKVTEVESSHEGVEQEVSRTLATCRAATSERPDGCGALMPVWVRRPAEVEPKIQEVGQVRIWPPTSTGGYEVRSSDYSIEGAYGSNSTSALFMRMRGDGEGLSEAPTLDGLHNDAPAEGEDVSGREGAYRGTDEEEQPHVRPGYFQKVEQCAHAGRVAHEGGTEVLRLGEGPPIACQFQGHRQTLDQQAKSRLSRGGSEEGDRDIDARHIQRRGSRAAHVRDVWTGGGGALHEERVAVSSGVLLGGLSPSSSGGLGIGGSRLLLAGIELERGLELRPIDSVRRIDGTVRVYNFSCPPIEAYEANGVIVHNCDFCAYRDPKYTSSTMFFVVDTENLKKGLRNDKDHPERDYNPNRQLSLAKAGEIIDDCAEIGVSGCQFTGGGEPTVHPQFNQILQYAQMKGLKTSVVTNGSLIIKKKLAETLARCSWVRVSLDAGNAKDYAKIRHIPGSQFYDALAGVAAIRTEREKQGTKVVIGVGFVVTPDNWQGIYDGVRLAKEHGADNIRISAQFSADEERLFSTFAVEAAALAAKAVADFADDSFQVFNRFSEKLDDLKQKAPDYETCGYQMLTTYIGADENLYRCCVYAYHPHGLYGSIKNKRFKDVWMDTERAEGMAAFKATSCARCQFNSQNRNLVYILAKEDPEHSEFV